MNLIKPFTHFIEGKNFIMFQFVVTARNVCNKLRKAGYWADFINPFSGRPYFALPPTTSQLYKTDEKFRCLDFQIFEIEKCTVISNEQDNTKKKFIGKYLCI